MSNFRVGQMVRVLDTPLLRQWEAWAAHKVGEVTSELHPHPWLTYRMGHLVVVEGETLFFAPCEIVPVDDDDEASWDRIEALTNWRPDCITINQG